MGNVGNCSRQNNAFEGPLSGFIPSYVPNSAEYDTLEDAKAAAQQFDNVGGSTKEPTGKFTLRAGNALMPSPAGSDEVSWRFIKEYPGCAKRFKGGHNAGQCVHGVGGNQQHYTCCGLTDVNAECPVKHLPLGVKLIKEFLNDAEQRAHVERLLQEPMVTKKGTLNFSPSLTIDKLDVVKNRGNEWLRRLTHGNDHQPFTWSNGHCYNGHSSWDPREVGSQPAHRDRGADVDRTLGISVGASMWFHYSLRDEDEVKREGGSAGGAFEHHVYVQSGDALLFDGMILTHAADHLEPGTEPGWWHEVLDNAGAGHLGNRALTETS